MIGGIGAFKSVGIVNLDINRARIEIHPNFQNLGPVTHPGGTTQNYQPIEQNRNCIVMGVRSNNTAFPDPAIPDTTQPGRMRKWQRAVYRFSANLDLYFAKNVIIANNRLNDNTTDNFDQPGYRVRNRCTICNNYKFIGQPGNDTWKSANYIPVISGAHARFSYDGHYGITLNRDKKVMINGVRTIQNYIWYPEPQQEPSLYAKGFLVLDNWVYITNRVGLWIAGQGMEVGRNVVRDSVIAGSSATPKKVWLSPNMQEVQRNYSGTYENRGIDFGGLDITIDSNDIVMRTFFFEESGQYGSIDGEGIMDQGNGGGTHPNGIYITNNTLNGDRDDCTNPTIGLYRNNEIYNVKYLNNTFTGNARCMMIDADRTNDPKIMANVLVEGNVGVKRLLIRGSLGGYNALAKDMTGEAGASANISCFVRQINVNNFALVNGACIPNAANGVDSANFPRIRMATPFRDTLLPAPVAAFPLMVNILSGTLDSIVFYRDSFVRIGAALIAGTEAFLAWDTPLHDGQYLVMAIGYFKAGSSVIKTKTELISIRIDDGNPFVNNPDDQLVSVEQKQGNTVFRELSVYPNPTRNGFFIGLGEEKAIEEVQITDALGRIQLVSGPSKFVKTEGLTSGLYWVKVKTKEGYFRARIVVE
jgi:hypothetical protein